MKESEKDASKERLSPNKWLDSANRVNRPYRERRDEVMKSAGLAEQLTFVFHSPTARVGNRHLLRVGRVVRMVRRQPKAADGGEARLYTHYLQQRNIDNAHFVGQVYVDPTKGGPDRYRPVRCSVQDFDGNSATTFDVLWEYLWPDPAPRHEFSWEELLGTLLPAADLEAARREAAAHPTVPFPDSETRPGRDAEVPQYDDKCDDGTSGNRDDWQEVVVDWKKNLFHDEPCQSEEAHSTTTTTAAATTETTAKKHERTFDFYDTTDSEDMYA